MLGRPRAHTWRFVTPAPAREVFAATEQVAGTPPYRFEVLGPDVARAVEVARRGFFGQWRRRVPRPRQVRVEARPVAAGTEVLVESSAGASPTSRALQVVQLLSRGARDKRTIYRERIIPPGPVSLVASWAGMPYRLLLEPRVDGPRGEAILTASRITAIADHGTLVEVRLGSGAEGYVEKDQLVPAPAEATREAQPRIATLG
ncbi:MAG: hypothetical protein E6J14_12325 [Chloroflexi bacterium]|nr:MAG: hypothetical protein E6J14_12325 [Chloroflexota bacterium]